jgi:hypothetical protein
MLPNLEDQFIDETFGGVLHTASQAVSSSDVKRVYDGYGNETPISVSTEAFKLGSVSYHLTAATDGSALIYENGVATFKSLLNSVYPVGSLYLSVEASNPTSIFGGVWNQVGQGRFLVGDGTGIDANSTGKTFTRVDKVGEYSHTQTVSELATHNHDIFITRSSQNDDNASPATGDIGTSSRAVNVANVLAGGLITLDKGSNQPFNVTPPSFGVYMWQRIS